jgi:integrase
MGASITTRTTKTGRRFVVRYRLGGRAYPVQHGGSFATMREARTRRDLMAGELAAGRNPAILLGSLAEAAQAPTQTFRTLAHAYESTRVDLAANTAKNIKSHLTSLLPAFGDQAPDEITPQDVQAWISSSKLRPTSLRRYMDTLRSILDYAGCDPNPARDSRVRMPRIERTVLEPPSLADVEAMLSEVTTRYRLPLRTLAETGMRVGELHELEWRDVDQAASRFRIRRGKTAAARRWVAVPDALMVEIAAATPPDDRTPERRVFPGASPELMRKAVDRACDRAGIAKHTPHSLRHRYISVQVARGVPVTNVAAQVGHTKNSMTLDTYSHVLIDG